MRIAPLVLAGLLALTACGPKSQPTSVAPSSSGPASSAPIAGLDKLMPQVETSLRLEAPTADAAYAYLQKLGDTYGKAWADYLPGLSFNYQLARAETLQTPCRLGGVTASVAPDGENLVGCLSDASKRLNVYVPGARLAKQLLPESGHQLAEPRIALIVAQFFGEQVIRHLDAVHLAPKRDSALQALTWACAAGITFRATHNLSNEDLAELIGWLFVKDSNKGELRGALLIGYKTGRLDGCYETRQTGTSI